MLFGKISLTFTFQTTCSKYVVEMHFKRTVIKCDKIYIKQIKKRRFRWYKRNISLQFTPLCYIKTLALH